MYPFPRVLHPLLVLSILLCPLFSPTLSQQPSKKGHVTSLTLRDRAGLSILASPGELASLESLTIISSDIFGPFPQSICKLSNLRDLTIRLTRLTGPIPGCLARLKNLVTLEISNNQNISGPIPTSLGQLAKLTSIRLGRNKLSGRIPDSLGHLRNLETLHLDFNHLSGPLPSYLGYLPNLTDVFLTGNRLSGLIPLSYGSFRKPVSLELGANQLTGPIPRTMRHLNASVIDVNGNKLTGDASFLFGRKKSFAKIINLGNNGFKFDLSNVHLPLGLEELIIDHNMIYGSLPKGLEKLPLVFVDVSYNQLCGRIPESERLTQFGETSFAHNKCLCGSPLPPCK